MTLELSKRFLVDFAAAMLIVFSVLSAAVTQAHAENVYVKNRGFVEVERFACSDVPNRSFIKRVCYDETNQYVLIKLNNAFCQYCEFSPLAFHELLAAKSIGRYFNDNMKGVPRNGPYDCQTHRMPVY
jgi:hypothetical protein